ncbi:MAG: GerMN domain-containing protein [Lachnospiraceae bacterium]
MKKLICGMLVLLSITMVGCQKKVQEKPIDKSTTTTADNKDKKDETTKTETVKEEKPIDNQEKKQKLIHIYYIDDATGTYVSKEMQWKEQDYQAIWEALKVEGMVTAESKLLNLKINNTDKTIDLDANQAFGDYIRTMGSTGEQEILACVVNTYLEACGCDKIKITEEEKVLETNNATLDYYMGMITLS